LTWGVLGALFILKWGSGKPKAENREGGEGSGVAKDAKKQSPIVAAIEALIHEYQAANADNAENSRKTLVWTKRAALLVAAYTVVTSGIFWVTRDQEHRQLRAQVGPVYDSFQIDCPECLAYIANPNGLIPQPVNLVDEIDYKLKNYGLSAAHHIIRCNDFLPLRPNEVSEWMRKQSRGCDSITGDVPVNPAIWPGEERDQVAQINDLRVAINVMTGVQKAYYTATIIYYDTFGTRHHTHICRICARVDKPDRPPAEEFFGCDTLNGIEDD
jgi:hypothetical protein